MEGLSPTAGSCKSIEQPLDPQAVQEELFTIEQVDQPECYVGHQGPCPPVEGECR